MKKLLVLAALLFVGLGYSQTYRISTVGESKQFVIEDVTNGVRERPYLNREVLADTTSQGNINIYRQLAVDYLKPIGFPKVAGRAYTEFVDGNNSDATFASSAAVLTWFADNTGFNSASGGSGADQELSLSGTDLSISGIGGNTVDLSPISGSTDFGDEIVYLTDYAGSDHTTLQAAIDELEAGNGGTIYVNKQITIGAANVVISGTKYISLIGTGTFAQILCGSDGNGVVVGSEGASTSAQVNFNNIRIYGADYYGTSLEIINHRRFNAVQSSFSGNVNGVVVRSYGDGGYTYDINFTDCEIESNNGIGLHVLNEWDGAGTDDQFVTHVTFKGGYITDNGVNIKLEKEANTGEVGSIQFSNLYVDNGDNSKVNLQMIGVNNCRFSNVTFDGATGGVDQITLDATSVDNTFDSCSFDGNVTDSGARNKYNGDKGIWFLTGNRSIGISDIGRSLIATADATYTLTASFSSMIRGQEIDLITEGKTVTVQGAVGVTVNGVSAGSKVVGDGANFLKHTIKKVGNNNFQVYASGAGSGGGFENPATADLNMNGNDLLNTSVITSNSGALTIDADAGSGGEIIFDNSVASATDIYSPTNRKLRIGNNGISGGASLQLGNSGVNYLFSFEGQGGFRYWSRKSGNTGEKFAVDDNGNTKAAKYSLSALNTAPSSATDTGTTGEIRITATHIYICTATNTWVRAALSTW